MFVACKGMLEYTFSTLIQRFVNTMGLKQPLQENDWLEV